MVLWADEPEAPAEEGSGTALGSNDFPGSVSIKSSFTVVNGIVSQHRKRKLNLK